MFKKGNAKIHKSCGIFNLPVSVGPVQCPGCYAKKAETRFKAVKASRDMNRMQSQSPSFAPMMSIAIRNKKVKKFRIHESGDFYSQEYISKWEAIVAYNHDVSFYAYTKREHDLDLRALRAYPNVNIINSITPLGLNYGDQKYCDELITKHGYTLCPCKKGTDVKCMDDCNICLTIDKVCFIKH